MDIRGLQDKVYELEGLIELLLQRDNKRDVLEPLIESKIKAISGFVGENSVETEKRDNDRKEPETVREPEPAVKVEPVIRQTVREKPMFCINDRFRFRRELFNDSLETFESEMERVAGMNSYEEAEDYFIGSLGWDPDNDTVMDFLEIMRQYFQ